jgi:hypothetical protein
MSGLIVPVDVIAYCIGTLDAAGPAGTFAGATTDFTNQASGKFAAYLGENVTRDVFADAPRWSLETGVHLHWAMPDALTHAGSAGGSMTFPALPNRWLVTRVAGNAQSSKHWIISSDALSSAPPGGITPPSVPVKEPEARQDGTPQRGFRYLGAWQVFDASWRESSPPPAHALAAVTGYELHAVATGDIAFAAFYPNARSVFGFHDDLADLGTNPAELMYVVVGWYASPANDPLNGGRTLDQLKTDFGWTFASAAPSPPSWSLYSGLVQAIAWNPATRYVSDNAEPIAGDVAIGNHPAEALAAYLGGKVHPALPKAEELLTLFITGLLPDLANPTAGQLAVLDEALHELQFTGCDGGTIYTITRGATEATGLPLPLADALNQLNLLQQAADLAAVQVRQAKWQLFANWYRLFRTENEDQQSDAAFNAFDVQFTLQPAIAQRAQTTAQAAAQQKTAVAGMLNGDLSLTPVPAQRYYAPTEPVVLLAGDAAAPAERYGGDGRYHPEGFLVCRLDSDVLTAVTVASTQLQASQFAALVPPAAQLPHPETIGALIEEAALLDTAIGAARSGRSEPALAADLKVWLTGGTAQFYGHPAGLPPSPVAVNAWPGANPWMSLMLLWQVGFYPLLATDPASGPVDYPASFFTANYSLDPNHPRTIAYTPQPGGITIDPAKINFDFRNPQSGTELYQGCSVLSPAAADNLREQLTKYLEANRGDTTAKQLADQLAAVDVSMQNLTGLNDALLTRERSLQVAIGIDPSQHRPIRWTRATLQVTSAIGSLSEIPALAPQLEGSYNGVRAGYFKLTLAVMDPFGRKRPVQVNNLYIADTLGAYLNGTLEPGICYAQPRVVQPARLLFRWLAADSTESDEMNAHPATTPICGWLLPDHLARGFFIYNAQGNPLGSLTLRADGSGVDWLASPGEQATIDADIVTVMQHQNPHLCEVSLALAGTKLDRTPVPGWTPAWFQAMWRAADTAVTQIVPPAPASQSGLAVLVGRPLAIAQAALRLERQGIAAFDQSFATLSGGVFPDTDHALGGVQFPVVVGDLARLDDGLVGYFKQTNAGAYDTTTFYSEAAPTGAGSDPHVTAPSPTNLLLTPAATPETQPGAPPTETKLLMLVDPRAAVHATMGILPTQTLAIPSDQYDDILAGLEIAFPATPVLRPAGGVSVPLPAIAGYNWSWISEEHVGSQAALAAPSSEWIVDADITAATARAVWQYSPQTLAEGWLRLNPELLQFALVAAGGSPVVTAGATVTLTLTITNKRRTPIAFAPASIVQEAAPKQGSLFYIHFGTLVGAAQVAAMRLSATGWQFQSLNDAHYGNYWGAAPTGATVTLKPGAALTITIDNVAVAAGSRVQSRVFFDYYNVTGIDDGVDIAILAVQQPNPAPVAA